MIIFGIAIPRQTVTNGTPGGTPSVARTDYEYDNRNRLTQALSYNGTDRKSTRLNSSH